MHKYLVALLSCFIISCSYFEQEQEVDAVARIGDAYLLRSEIQNILPADYTVNDSALMVQKYIDDWTTDQMLMKNALQNISQDKQDNLDLLISRYKTELYSQAYLQEIIKQNLDTTIPNSETRDYFQQHREEFILNEDLIKFKYLLVDQTYSEMDKVNRLFQDGSRESLKELEDMALGFRNYSFNDSIWVKKSTLLERLTPVTALNEGQYLIPGRSWKLEDSLGVYLLHIKDVLRRGEQAPLTYVNPTIKQILRNQRKLAYIKKIEKELLDDAIQSNRLKINP
ncbi:hypothetical protein SAMN05192588_1660 [Nonlabens sp. Hel1_33_55]|uniref:hypothetical protein n=1 Tax=Nonlabens sp. Hel1_33_55 TaxID=1336802 RepID=UPI000875AA89|nr:hypothetical protein [Nonlabens sp. Hel1_33_55]SCY20588.1 hypothetical protein SAMN05192588_1660 [Nonlabens sp. Hel1_33_55]